MQRETSQTPPPNIGLTLADLIRDIYLPIHTKWGPNTRAGFMSTIKLHILPQLGGMAIKDLNKIVLQKHLIALAGRGLGEAVLTRVRQILHAAFEDAVDGDYLERNPARKLEIPACKAPAATRSLTEEEVGRLFGCLQGKERLFFRVLIMCGARVGEVLALRREDVQVGTITFSGSALYGKRGPTKSRKARTVPLTLSLEAEIEHYLFLRIDANPLVFPSERGTIMRREGWPLFLMIRARNAAGIPDLDYHMTRRTFATLYEGPEVDVQDLLGHSSVKVTREHYIKPINVRQRAAIEEMERRLTGSASSSVGQIDATPVKARVQ